MAHYILKFPKGNLKIALFPFSFDAYWQAGGEGPALWSSEVYPVESLTIHGGDEEKNVYSLWRAGFKALSFLTGLTPEGKGEKEG
jgi:hypothetical protein